MKRYYLVGILGTAMVLGLLWYVLQEPAAQMEEAYVSIPTSFNDATYLVEGEHVTLKSGYAATFIPDAGTTTTRVFGNEVVADMNGDGTTDTAFILTQEPGGSGTFFYIAAALNFGGQYEGTNAIFLGDRIAPQTTEFLNGSIVVNYADRAEGEPMSAEPTVGVSKYFRLEGKQLVAAEEVVPDMDWVLSPVASTGVQFSYPAVLPTKYISASAWPPEVGLTAGEYSCEESEAEGERVAHLAIDGREYCRATTVEGAAGSTYTQYEYTGSQGDYIVKVAFTLQTPQCMNYDEPERSACTEEQESFSVDALADRIAVSLSVR